MSKHSKKRYPLGDYGLTFVLLALFLVSIGLQTYGGWKEFSAEQLEHAQKPEIWGESGYVWTWLSKTMENWQSEFLQLLTFVTLTAIFVHRGSHQSKDTDDDTADQLARIEQSVKAIEKKVS
ncbi:MAG: hypothetical protein HONBIEJF_00216 [Fimbriimonadaceae bacterium]|nr:hypothetical protein [Fimbriimonadaceae bacterium]